MAQRHGNMIRGLASVNRSLHFEGRFGRMFRFLHPAHFGNTESEIIDRLTRLGNAMSATFDPPKDGKDDEESGIPALYTYFGQFIDHDITFDPMSSLQKQNDPDALTDFRSPAFDLDNVYGRGPDDQPYLYDNAAVPGFLLGDAISGGDAGARDLQRNQMGRALIGDPRNDENTIVSQLQGLFLRFHNRTVQDNPKLSFDDIQKLVRYHYQYVILEDFLPRIIHAQVLSDLRENGRYAQSKLKYFHWKNSPFLPVEFSAAAYRLGHSMVRPGYRLNDDTLLPIFPVATQNLPEGLTGFRAMNPQWGIDWGRFIDIDTRQYDGTDEENRRRLQLAYRIDTSLVNPLSSLPTAVASDPPPSLAQRNLIRGWRLSLPSGQSVAHAMNIKPIHDKEILIGKGVDKPDAPLQSIIDVDPAFGGNCPLWTYVLAEAMQSQVSVEVPVTEKVTITTPMLGPVGGRIVAEVFLGLMFGDKHSLLNAAPGWTPETGSDYRLRDFVAYALGR